MTEKLNEYEITSRDGPFINAECNTKIINTLVRKINELVDAVNELQKHEEQHLDLLTQLNEMRLHQNEEPIDLYAEQRGWIGKLCRFWNFKDGAVDIGILKAVDNLKPTIPYINDIDCSYAFCEPVKPDDPIIYKGGDNED